MTKGMWKWHECKRHDCIITVLWCQSHLIVQSTHTSLIYSTFGLVCGIRQRKCENDMSKNVTIVLSPVPLSCDVSHTSLVILTLFFHFSCKNQSDLSNNWHINLNQPIRYAGNIISQWGGGSSTEFSRRQLSGSDSARRLHIVQIGFFAGQRSLALRARCHLPPRAHENNDGDLLGIISWACFGISCQACTLIFSIRNTSLRALRSSFLNLEPILT